MIPFRQAPTRIPTESTTVLLKHLSLVLEDDAASLLYAILARIRQANSLRREADKNLHLAQERTFATTTDALGSPQFLKKATSFTLHRPSPFRPDAERYTAERYSKMLPRSQTLYKAVDVDDNKLHILWDVLDYAVSIYSAGLARAMRRYCRKPDQEE